MSLQDHRSMLRNSSGLRPLVAHLALFAALVLQLLIMTKIHRDWWFEDDPNLAVFVKDHPLPHDYFFNRPIIRTLSPSRILTPMQPLSFWLDERLGPGSVAFAYGHTFLALCLAAFLFFHVLRRFFTDRVALFTTLLWLALPSTLAVVEFLAARHYLEGFMWLSASLLCALKALDGRGWRFWAWFGGCVLFYVAAALSKELYPTIGFLLLACFLGGKPLGANQLGTKRRAACILALAFCFFGYLAYRAWAVGLVGQGFGSAFDFGSHYHLFLARLPHIFSGNVLGYSLLVGVIVLAVGAYRQKRLAWRHAWFWSAQLAVALATIFPVTEHLTQGYLELGTWYRVGFLLNTLLLVMGAWLVDRFPASRPIKLFVVLAFVAIGWGGWSAARQWDERKRLYQEAGQFYVANADKLLFTRLPAFFFDGLHNLYHREHPLHYISARTPTPNVYKSLRRFDSVWRRTAEGFGVDQALHSLIETNYRNGVVPLDRPIQKKVAEAQGGNVRRGLGRLVVSRGHLQIWDEGTGLEPRERWPLEKIDGWSWLPFPTAPLTGREVGLVFQNPWAEALSIKVDYLNSLGESLHQDNSKLGAGENLVASLRARLEPGKLAALARAEILASRGLAVMGFLEDDGGQFQLLRPAKLRQEGHFPHIPSPNGGWETRFWFCNPGGTPCRLNLIFYSEGGGKTNLTILLSGGESLTLSEAEFPKTAAAMAFRAENDGVLALQTVIGHDGGRAFTPPIETPSLRLKLPSVNEVVEIHWRGLAVFNPGKEPARVQWENQTGEALGNLRIQAGAKAVLDLKTLGHVTFILSDLPVLGCMVYQTRWGRLGMAPLEQEP